jgi:hypothetical protein
MKDALYCLLILIFATLSFNSFAIFSIWMMGYFAAEAIRWAWIKARLKHITVSQ